MAGIVFKSPVIIGINSRIGRQMHFGFCRGNNDIVGIVIYFCFAATTRYERLVYNGIFIHSANDAYFNSFFRLSLNVVYVISGQAVQSYLVCFAAQEYAGVKRLFVCMAVLVYIIQVYPGVFI